VTVAILDVDGTLVDTNYHHALAWYRAFRARGIVVPLWRLHRHVGMGGDKYVAAVAGDEVEERLGDELRADWQRLFDELLPEVSPVAGAHAPPPLKERGHEVVLASSAVAQHLDAFLTLLEARELTDSWTSKDDVDRSKPDPDLVRAALEKAAGDEAVMVGDTPWDVEAARRAGVDTICVVTGGFAEQELREAGAVAVFESVEALRRSLDETPLR
jgi:phosphoglycolate phosphatase-like HAD superfamily hydrolase